MQNMFNFIRLNLLHINNLLLFYFNLYYNFLHLNFFNNLCYFNMLTLFQQMNLCEIVINDVIIITALLPNHIFYQKILFFNGINDCLNLELLNDNM